MDFEYDSAKSAANFDKHGLDFEAAQALWDDDGLILAPADHPVEERFMALGRIEGRIWAAVYTARTARIRLISVRPAKRKERAIYEHSKGPSAPDHV